MGDTMEEKDDKREGLPSYALQTQQATAVTTTDMNSVYLSLQENFGSLKKNNNNMLGSQNIVKVVLFLLFVVHLCIVVLFLHKKWQFKQNKQKANKKQNKKTNIE